ncbi:hypothetical protein B0H19DRAFT_417803 [Mycena capillaripes]|nr:hypothetical protein B0H19DRAFT_417803 [Mycena capillaripes]
MHTVQRLGSSPDVVVFMGSRKKEAAEEALSKFAADVHSSSTVVPVQLDITDDASIKAAHAFLANFLKEKGVETLDVLVNNAAAGTTTFKETYEVNVLGTVAVTEAFLPLLSKGGAVLNISSGFASIAAYTKRPSIFPFLAPAYASSKAALNSLTVQWALQEDQKGSGIRVVSICPGMNATKMNNYAGTRLPSEGCKVIVKAALEKEGRTGVFFNEEGDIAW